MMYNPQLDTFICVVEAGSFSKAAEELYISAPAVIKKMARQASTVTSQGTNSAKFCGTPVTPKKASRF